PELDAVAQVDGDEHGPAEREQREDDVAAPDAIGPVRGLGAQESCSVHGWYAPPPTSVSRRTGCSPRARKPSRMSGRARTTTERSTSTLPSRPSCRSMIEPGFTFSRILSATRRASSVAQSLYDTSHIAMRMSCW